MPNKFTILVAISSFLTLSACSENSTTIPKEESEVAVKDEKGQQVTKNIVQEIPEYKITEDTVKRNVKRTVEVELPSRIDEEPLRALAEEVYGLSKVKVERTFIIYRIAGDEGDGSGWATTHYNPNLEVKIIGASASDYEKIKNTNVSEGEILGSWMFIRGMESKATLYKKDGQVYMREVYNIGALPNDRVYELTELDEGLKLQSENDKSHDEYFIINKKGDLEFWSADGNYYTAKKI